MIEVFADVVCPFTHVGLRRLVGRRAGRGGPFLHVRAWPLELVNGAPVEGELVAEEVAALREQVAPDLFGGFDPAHFPATSLPALTLAAAAYRAGDQTGERVSLALRDALFESGVDVADPSALDRIARAHGLEPPTTVDRDGITADWAEGRARGVEGSPHFFLGADGFFCPSLEISTEGGELRIATDPAAFDEFVTRALGER